MYMTLELNTPHLRRTYHLTVRMMNTQPLLIKRKHYKKNRNKQKANSLRQQRNNSN